MEKRGKQKEKDFEGERVRGGKEEVERKRSS